jgi:hypothetical protein
MKLFLCLLTGWLLAFSSPVSFAQVRDTLTTAEAPVSSSALTAPAPIESSDGGSYSPIFYVLEFGLLCLLMSFVGAGVIFILAGLVVIMALVAFGLLSSSLLVGLHKRSLTTGINLFIMTLAIVCGLAMGGPGLWMINSYTNWLTSDMALISGLFCGLIAGILLGLITCNLLHRFVQYVKLRLNV